MSKNDYIIQDGFLTKILGKDCFNILYPKQNIIFSNNAFYTFKFNYDPETIIWCNENKFFYAGSQITLKRKNTNQKKININTTITFTKEVNNKDKASLKNIAEGFVRFSRFSSDPYIRSYTTQIYTEWLFNSLFSKYVSDYIVVRDKNTIVGICTLRIVDTAPRIDLLGVNKSHKRQGIAQGMLEELLKKYAEEDIYVGTQAENLPALTFYLKLGFIPRSYSLVFHKHT